MFKELISFQNTSFPCRRITLKEYGDVLICSDCLGEKLITTGGEYTSDLAMKVDEAIFYFADKELFFLSPNDFHSVLKGDIC